MSERKIGKRMGADLYVHKDYVHATDIPKRVYDNAVSTLKEKHPDHKYNIVKYNKLSDKVSFLHSPDWDSNPEPYIHDSVLVHPDGTTKYSKPKKDPQIYHKKHLFVGDDYKGFDIEKSKHREKVYMKAIAKVKAMKNDPQVSKKIGYKSYWDKEIVPHIED